ncbi:MAG: sulfite exporter TauE/SafE family protein [Deltaproteobacteria bacterium]|nr:MAG: sulfite exporter TauE/SafE family protein [Deltaproteobacteria bacterium]
MDLLQPDIIALILVSGGFGGFLAGLLGIGGGVIFVPLFLHLFPLVGIDSSVMVHMAFGTSLGIILPTALSSTFAHRKRGNVDWHHVYGLAAGGIAGAVCGSSLAALLEGDSLQLAFAGMQIAVALRMFRQRRYLPPERSAPIPFWQLFSVGCAGGLFSSFFGVGGGVIAVPLMVIALQLPVHLAVGNSSALIVVSALAGTISYAVHGLGDPMLPSFSLGYVNLLVAGLIAPLSMLMARIGVRVAVHLPHDKLVKAFAILLILVAVKIGWRALS